MTNPNPFTAFAAFDPMGYVAASQQQMMKWMSEAQVRAQTVADQYAQLESQMVARTQQAVTTMAQLAQDAVTYSAQLATEARKLTMAKWSEAMAAVPTVTPPAAKA